MLDVPLYQDKWNDELTSNARRAWVAIKTRFGLIEPLFGEEPRPPKRWQWNFAETQREQVAELLRKAKDTGLAEILDFDATVKWTLSLNPQRDAVSIRTLLSLASVCLTLLDEEPQENG